MEVGWRRQWGSLFGWLGIVLLLFWLSKCSVKTPLRRMLGNINVQESKSAHGLNLLIQEHQVVMDNGLVQVTFSSPEGIVTGIQYNGIRNILEMHNKKDDRGYWDLVWNEPGHRSSYDRLEGTSFKVIMEDENQIEISFKRTWSLHDSGVPLNVDKRFVMLLGSSGFYAYAIYERLEGWPDFDLDQTRIVFKLQQNMFHYMAISDDRQRVMPMMEDRATGQPLAFPEAVLLTHPRNPALAGEVDDKYQYSCDNKDNRVHGWICTDPPVGFWMITPSNEFRTAGPLKQDLTSHVGPITLSMFVSIHYSGEHLALKFRNGEPWKKVFGPVFVYLNSVSDEEDPLTLWADAKKQMSIEVESWPYSFPLSEDFPSSDQRGTVTGQLLVHDRYINEKNISAGLAYVGLAPPGDVGTWQGENKGYQFWNQSDNEGHFLIKGVRAGNYSVNAWVPGIIGDYKYDVNINITPGSKIDLGVLVYDPPRDGPTLWEIGIPDRTAAEFYVPGPNLKLVNQLYINDQDKFRQYGLWERYTDLYPDHDLIYNVSVSDYRKDWFFAQVTRKTRNNTYQATTWQILFDLKNVDRNGAYKLRVALASAAEAELQVRINNPNAERAHFTTGLIGKDNTIARHGIHGLYWLYSIDVPGVQLVNGSNTIYLTQPRSEGPFEGIMYDYIRLEGPP